jgi:hypothetical protein
MNLFLEVENPLQKSVLADARRVFAGWTFSETLLRRTSSPGGQPSSRLECVERNFQQSLTVTSFLQKKGAQKLVRILTVSNQHQRIVVCNLQKQKVTRTGNEGRLVRQS